MQSKNKASRTKAEDEHITRIKAMDCVVCDAAAPTECHEIEQGQWFTSIPLCPDCHRGPHNGIHGRKAIWNVKKLDELSALNLVIKQLMETCV